MLEVYKFNEAHIRSDIQLIGDQLGQDPFVSLRHLFATQSVKKYFLAAFDQSPSPLAIADEFITQGRFENNIRPCSRRDLEQILSKSYESVFE